MTIYQSAGHLSVVKRMEKQNSADAMNTTLNGLPTGG
jgi:hypothetical protein